MKYKVLNTTIEGLTSRVRILGKAEEIKAGEQIADEYNVHYKVLSVSDGPDKYFNGMDETTDIVLDGMFSSRKIITGDDLEMITSRRRLFGYSGPPGTDVQ